MTTLEDNVNQLRLVVGQLSSNVVSLTERVAALEAVGRPELLDGPDELSDEAKATYDKLVEWRRAIAEQEDFAAYRVFSNRVLAEIVRVNPSTLHGLSCIKGVGPKKTQLYGPEVLGLLSNVPW